LSITSSTAPASTSGNQPPSTIFTEHDATSSASSAMKKAVAPTDNQRGKPQARRTTK
jgi:hypothetical protein